MSTNSNYKESIFRKTSIERISSPEQLNEYVKNVSPGLLVTVLALCAIAIGIIIWGFTGSINEIVKADGIVTEETVTASLSFDDAITIEAGMDVQISLSYAPRENYGFIYGTVEEVFRQDGKAKIAITTENGQPMWSSEKGAAVELAEGAVCSVTIIKKERKPYELVLGGF